MQESICTNCCGVYTGICRVCRNVFAACVYAVFVFYFYGVLVIFATTWVYIFANRFYSGDLCAITFYGESLYFWESNYVLPCYVDALVVYAGNGFLYIAYEEADSSVAAIFINSLQVGYSIIIGENILTILQNNVSVDVFAYSIARVLNKADGWI